MRDKDCGYIYWSCLYNKKLGFQYIQMHIKRLASFVQHSKVRENSYVIIVNANQCTVQLHVIDKLQY